MGFSRILETDVPVIVTTGHFKVFEILGILEWDLLRILGTNFLRVLGVSFLEYSGSSELVTLKSSRKV